MLAKLLNIHLFVLENIHTFDPHEAQPYNNYTSTSHYSDSNYLQRFSLGTHIKIIYTYLDIFKKKRRKLSKNNF